MTVAGRITINRNRDGLLLGVSWAHHKSWDHRLTHFYLGLWVLTIRTGG